LDISGSMFRQRLQQEQPIFSLSGFALDAMRSDGIGTRTLDRDDFSLNRHHDLSSCLSMIFSENRFPLFGIML